MIYCIIFKLLEQVAQIGHLNHYKAMVVEHILAAFEKIDDRIDMGENIVADDQIRLSSLLPHFFPVGPAKESDIRGDTFKNP